MRRTPIVTGIALAAVAGLAAPARAEMRVWTMCLPGTFHSCHSVSLRTLPIFTGGVQTGTNITITLTNLQGSGFPADNTLHSALTGVEFFARNQPNPIGEYLNANLTSQVVGNAINDAGFFVQTDDYANGTQRFDEIGAFSFQIGGCAVQPPFPWVNYMTCGAQSAVIMTFDVASFVDVTGFDNARIIAIDTDSSRGGSCMSDPSSWLQDPANFPQPPQAQCDTYSNVLISPEPVTIALLGTGLFGVGAARWRRRRPVPGDPA